MEVVNAGLVGIGLLALILLCSIRWVVRRFEHTAIYDMRLVAEKTGRSAYRARLRLFVIESAGVTTPGASMEATPSGHSRSFLLLRHDEIIPSCVRHTYRQWRQTSLRKRERSRTHSELLDRLTGAYRQYHTAAGGYFVPRQLSQPTAQRLLVKRNGRAYVLSGWAYDIGRSRHILSVADVAVLWHLPQSSDLADLPLLERGRARTFLVPRELTSGDGWRIGWSTHAGHTLPASLTADMLRHNL